MHACFCSFDRAKLLAVVSHSLVPSLSASSRACSACSGIRKLKSESKMILRPTDIPIDFLYCLVARLDKCWSEGQCGEQYAWVHFAGMQVKSVISAPV